MSIKRNDEAQRLWEKIRQLERLPCKTEEDFQHKKREMKALQDAYARVTGMSCDPNNIVEQQSKGEAAAFRGLFGGGPEHPTAEDLNDMP